MDKISNDIHPWHLSRKKYVNKDLEKKAFFIHTYVKHFL